MCKVAVLRPRRSTNVSVCLSVILVDCDKNGWTYRQIVFRPHRICVAYRCALYLAISWSVCLAKAVTRIYFRGVLGLRLRGPKGRGGSGWGGVLEKGAPPTHQLRVWGALYRGYRMVTFQNLVMFLFVKFFSEILGCSNTQNTPLVTALVHTTAICSLLLQQTSRSLE